MDCIYSAPIRFGFASTVVAFMTLAAVGCGGQGNVSGKVTYLGQPLVFGTVQFEASDGALKQSNINKDGTYSIQGLAVGAAKAAVNSPDPTSSDRRPPRREGTAAVVPLQEFPDWFPIPEKYQNLSKPQLSYTIKSGQNTIDIELK
jgi:hypothetical protein